MHTAYNNDTNDLLQKKGVMPSRAELEKTGFLSFLKDVKEGSFRK